MNKVQDLAEEHWGYIESLLEQHGESDDVVDKIGFHYKTAFVHGYKHGVEEYKKSNVGHDPFLQVMKEHDEPLHDEPFHEQNDAPSLKVEDIHQFEKFENNKEIRPDIVVKTADTARVTCPIVRQVVEYIVAHVNDEFSPSDVADLLHECYPGEMGRVIGKLTARQYVKNYTSYLSDKGMIEKIGHNRYKMLKDNKKQILSDREVSKAYLEHKEKRIRELRKRKKRSKV